MPRSTRSRRSSARCSTSRGSTPARCGRTSSASASTSCCVSSRSSSPAGARKGPRADVHALLARDPLRPPPAAAAAAEPRLQRDQVHAEGPRAGRLPAARRKLRIDVFDTGLGIPGSKKRVIFREFQRLDEGAKVARGLGLGLSIVERIARVLDHKVDLRSMPRRGSRFSVEVPVSSEAPRAGAARGRGRRPRTTRRHRTVLCIDNEPKVLDGMETLLGGWGCRVLKAPDLASAVAAVADAQAAPQRAAGRLPPRPRQRPRSDRRTAPPLRRRPAGDPDHRRPLAARCATRRSARDVQVLSKPLKPAALRALMAQWRVQRVAAAE